MPIIQINHDPTRRQIREFGVVSLFALPALAWWWTGVGVVFLLMLVAGVLLCALSWWRPAWVKVIYIGASYLVYPLGVCLGWLALVGLFFGLFVPIGYLCRLVGRDRLVLRRPQDVDTFWTPKRRPQDVASYYRQS